MEQSEFLYFNVKYKTSLIEIDLRAYICHLNFRILLTLKYRDDIVRNDNMEEVHIRRMY